MQELNAQIVRTQLQAERIGLDLAFMYQGQQGGAFIPFEMTKENIGSILSLTGATSWELVNEKYVRLRLEGEGEQMKIVGFGHVIADSWIEIKEDETATE